MDVEVRGTARFPVPSFPDLPQVEESIRLLFDNVKDIFVESVLLNSVLIGTMEKPYQQNSPTDVEVNFVATVKARRDYL